MGAGVHVVCTRACGVYSCLFACLCVRVCVCVRVCEVLLLDGIAMFCAVFSSISPGPCLELLVVRRAVSHKLLCIMHVGMLATLCVRVS